MEYDSVVFDQDGVLTELTDESVLKEGVRETFESHGVADPNPVHVDELTEPIGEITVEIVSELCADYDLDPRTLWTERQRTLAELQRIEIRDGRKQLYGDVEHLHRSDLKMGIVSNNQQATVEFVTEWFDLEDRFDTYYGVDPALTDLKNRKPDPHYLERAQRDLESTDPLYVGDSSTDIAAAHEAGIDVALLRRDEDYDSVRRNEHATHRIASIREIGDLIE